MLRMVAQSNPVKDLGVPLLCHPDPPAESHVPVTTKSVLYIAIAAALGIVTACGDRECLPPPTEDESPPEVSMTLIYRPPGSVRPDTLSVSPSDSTIEVDADRDGAVSVAYQASDEEGIRRVELGVTVLTTVGVGIDSRRVPTEPLVAPCPRFELGGDWIAPRMDVGSHLSLGVTAENWIGLRRFAGTVTVRFR